MEWKVAGPVLLTAVVGFANSAASFVLARPMMDWAPGVKKIV